MAIYDKSAYERTINSMSIPSKKVTGVLGEIFIKGTRGDRLLINKLDSTLVPFREEGLVNAAFSDFLAGVKDAGIDGYKARQISMLKDSITDKAHFERLKDSILHNADLDKKVFFRQRVVKVKSILQSSIVISVDDKKVNPAAISCDFYFHPDAKAKGLLCFFPLDSLAIGRHYYKIGKVKGVQPSNSTKHQDIYLDTVFHTIPFIYTETINN